MTRDQGSFDPAALMKEDLMQIPESDTAEDFSVIPESQFVSQTTPWHIDDFLPPHMQIAALLPMHETNRVLNSGIFATVRKRSLDENYMANGQHRHQSRTRTQQPGMHDDVLPFNTCGLQVSASSGDNWSVVQTPYDGQPIAIVRLRDELNVSPILTEGSTSDSSSSAYEETVVQHGGPMPLHQNDAFYDPFALPDWTANSPHYVLPSAEIGGHEFYMATAGGTVAAHGHQSFTVSASSSASDGSKQTSKLIIEQWAALEKFLQERINCCQEEMNLYKQKQLYCLNQMNLLQPIHAQSVEETGNARNDVSECNDTDYQHDEESWIRRTMREYGEGNVYFIKDDRTKRGKPAMYSQTKRLWDPVYTVAPSRRREIDSNIIRTVHANGSRFYRVDTETRMCTLLEEIDLVEEDKFRSRKKGRPTEPLNGICWQWWVVRNEAQEEWKDFHTGDDLVLEACFQQREETKNLFSEVHLVIAGEVQCIVDVKNMIMWWNGRQSENMSMHWNSLDLMQTRFRVKRTDEATTQSPEKPAVTVQNEGGMGYMPQMGFSNAQTGRGYQSASSCEESKATGTSSDMGSQGRGQFLSTVSNASTGLNKSVDNSFEEVTSKSDLQDGEVGTTDMPSLLDNFNALSIRSTIRRPIRRRRRLEVRPSVSWNDSDDNDGNCMEPGTASETNAPPFHNEILGE